MSVKDSESTAGARAYLHQLQSKLQAQLAGSDDPKGNLASISRLQKASDLLVTRPGFCDHCGEKIGAAKLSTEPNALLCSWCTAQGH